MEDIEVAVPGDRKGSVGVGEELSTLWRLLKMRTFSSVVLQGCFGVIPWRALDFRLLFFQLSGLSDFHASLLSSIGQLSMAPGCYIGGAVGDELARRNPVHGRIWCAQIAVFSSMIITSLTF